MTSRFLLTAVFAAGLSTPLTAEPAKLAANSTSQSTSRPAEVLLASAEIRSPTPTSEGQSAPAPKRPRVARVTSCRCGGQLPAESGQQP